ncbi:MAG: hypothetical protein Q4G33_07230 [bacterium]|nr:hypothetical protein [bacterium]
MERTVSVLAVPALACGTALNSYAADNTSAIAQVSVNGTLLDDEALIMNYRTMIHKIAEIRTDGYDKPVTDCVIERVEVIK